MVKAARSRQVQDLIDPGAIRQQIAVDEFVDGTLQGMGVRDAEQLADTILGIKRDTTFVRDDGQKEIEQSFRMTQAFKEALANEAMFNPSETAVPTTDAIGAKNGDVGSHGQKRKAMAIGSPSRFVSLTRG